MIFAIRKADYMEMICTLDIEDNTCPYLESDKRHCAGQTVACGFRFMDTKNISQKKAPKWFEKYYEAGDYLK